jgi:hypothetical protein
MYEVCEAATGARIDYTFGLAVNPVLKRAAEPVLQRAIESFAQTQQPSRCFDQFFYRADTWKNPRRVIVKAECNQLGTNLRFIVTDRAGAGEHALVLVACSPGAPTMNTPNAARVKTATRNSRPSSAVID